MTSYAAPLGIAATPFGSHGVPFQPFPGEPGFRTPAGNGGLSLPFPVTGAPRVPPAAAVGGFALAQRSANRVSDWGTNGFVAHHLVAVPNRNDEGSSIRLQNIGLSMLCFARDMNQTLSKQRKFRDVQVGSDGSSVVNYGPAVGDKSVEVFELSQLNDHLRDKRVSRAFATARDLVNEFRLLGVVLTEVAPSSDRDYGGRPSTRVINYVVRGRCKTFNFWPGMHSAGTELWLIVKKYKAFPDEPMVWVFEPYASGDRPRPTLQDVSWVEDNVLHVGASVYVGQAGQNQSDIAYAATSDVKRQRLYDTVMSPTIEVHLRI